MESVQDVAALTDESDDRLAYLTQTTLSRDDAEVIVEALKKRYPGIQSPPSDDICYATTNRQMAVRLLANESDLVLVVGSKNSSNSTLTISTLAGPRGH